MMFKLYFGDNSDRPSGNKDVIQGSGSEKGQKLNEKRLYNAYEDYSYERAYASLKASHDAHPDRFFGRLSDAELQSRARSDAAASRRSLENVFRQMRNTIDKHGGTITVSESLPSTYRETSANSNIYGKLKYKGIFPTNSESAKKLSEFNPNSRANRAYVKEHGNQSFGFGLELPRGVIDNYLKKKTR